tara:strand:+ start:48081 stop:50057 length:1977 start_codon:yes stop_codon:yes gene_type:complete
MKNKFIFIVFNIFLVGQLFGFLKTDGEIIVNENNEKVILKGFGLGGWLVLEGYMWNYPGFGSTSVLETEIENLIGSDKKKLFFEAYRENYINEKEIKFLADNGFNALRIPLHYKHFSASKNSFSEEGFQILDPVISLCKKYGIYIILDMHAAPGAQNTNDFSDSDGQNAYLFTEESNQEWLASIWKYIADYYANEPIIAAYDLLNEPVLPWGKGPSVLRQTYETSIDSIREVDQNHIVIIEGNWYGNDHSGLLPPFDSEMVYSFHHYIGGIDDTNYIHQYTTNLQKQFNVPLWVGEVGENSNTWAHNKKSFFESKNIGWSWWNFKSLERISSLFSYRKTEDFQRIIDFWQGSGPKPDTLDAFTTLMSFAELTSFDSCDINIGLVRALVDSSFSYVSKPFSSFKPPGQLPSINYDTGNNGVAYYDNQSVDPNKFSPETKSWNNGWTYRNDGVDIGVSNAGIEESYYVGWIEDGEWMIYTLNPGKPTNQKVSLEVASYINGCEVTVEFDSSYFFHKVQLPNTNGWDNGWRTITIGNVSLSGKTKMKIKAETGGFNLKSIIFQNIDESIIPMSLRPTIYPNPVNSIAKIKWNSDFYLKTDINIYNVFGNLVLNHPVMSNKGVNQINWDMKSSEMKSLPSGIYFINIETSNAKSTIKLTFLK